jgi:putative MATE family efflux protein
MFAIFEQLNLIEIRRMTTELSETTERMGTAPLGKLLLSLSLPGVASMISMTLYNLIDTIWLARLGHEAIAALTITFPYQILAIAVGVGTGIGISALTSRRFGEGNIEATNHAAGQVFSMSGFLGGIFLIAAVCFPRPILNILGATPDIIDYGTQYLVIIGIGTPFHFFSIMSSSLLRGSGDALRPMIFMTVGTVTNIILDPFMIFGWGPFPEMGVRGAALATIITQLLSAGLGFYYIVIARKSTYQIGWRHLKPSWPVIRDINRVGLPAVIMDIGESITFLIFNNVLSSFGSVAIAAAGIGFRVADLAWMPVFGVQQGLLPIIGFNFGAHLWKRLWGAVKIAAVGLMIFSTLLMVILEILAPQIIGVFSHEKELMDMAIPALRMMMSSLFIVGPLFMFITTLQGLSKGKEALVLTLIRQFVIFVPLIFFLSRIWELFGVWLSMPISDTFSCLISGLWLYREYILQQRKGVWSDTPVVKADD